MRSKLALAGGLAGAAGLLWIGWLAGGRRCSEAIEMTERAARDLAIGSPAAQAGGVERSAHAADEGQIETLAQQVRSMPAPVAPWHSVMCCGVHDEARNLAHWVNYHYLLGVDHFILYDFASTDNPRGAIANMIDAGLVEIHAADIEGHSDAYWIDACTAAVQGRAQWVLPIDVDEYVYLATRPTSSRLRPTEYQAYLDRSKATGVGVIQVSRFNMGTNGVVERSNLSAPDAFTERQIAYYPDSSPKAIGLVGHFDLDRMSQHNLYPLPGWRRVDVRGQPVETDTPSIYEPLRIVHFHTRSWDECAAYFDDPVRSGSWRIEAGIDAVCGSWHPGHPSYDAWGACVPVLELTVAAWTEDFTLQRSVYNQAARLLS